MYSGRLVRWVASFLGRHIHDEEDGCLLGRAFVVSWRGRVLIIGYTGLVPLRLVVCRDQRLNYWKLTIGFSAAREPDFPRER